MAALKILIKKSANTSTLRGLANYNVELEHMEISEANIPAAMAEIAIINNDNLMFSSIVTGENGAVNEIVLPKEAIKK